mmetsp:Transcript_17183/g.30913  ORF Transcript_17183/g.30913 Transcript_17183/m.30913 type:complete len:290 (+) Transcript_17183:48-917(+)
MANKEAVFSPHVRSTHKSVRTFQSHMRREGRTKTSQEPSRLLKDVYDSLPPSEKVSYRQLSFMFDENASASPDKKNVRSRAKLAEMKNQETTPVRRAYRRSTDLKHSRKTSLDLVFNQYYECDEPEFAQWRSLASAMEQIDPEVAREDTIYPYGIFISGLSAANDYTQLSHNSIKAVLSLGSQNEPAHYPIVTGGYLTVPLEADGADMRTHFNAAFRFLDSHLKKGNVLVHCFHGISRSCAVVAAFFIKTYSYTPERAIELVQAARKVTMIAPTLQRELEALAIEVSLG